MVKRCRMDNRKLIAAELAMEAVKEGLGVQVLVGVGVEMRCDRKRDYMVEVRAGNNKFGMEEGWYEVGEVVEWLCKNIQVR